MRVINAQHLKLTITRLKINKNLQKRLNVSSLSNMVDSSWQSHELFGLPTKDGIAGILFIEHRGTLYATPYEINVIRNQSTGHSSAIICDFCKTWQTGGRAGSITFPIRRRSLDSVSFLCCLDLKCSQHVRDLTESAKSSRAQIRETISDERRIERLENTLSLLIKKLNLKPIS